MLAKILQKKKKKINLVCFNKLKEILIIAYLIFLPTQLGKHFFFDFSYLNGIRVDYLSPTLYFNDLIFFSLLLINLNLILKYRKIFLFTFFIFLINIIFALIKPLTLYYWLRVFQWIMVFLIIKNNPLHLNKIVSSFIITALIELFLSFYHLTMGQSIQSIFYFLGERSFSLSTPSIAKGFLFDKEFLRPYGTFSHPNSLAGFYLLLYFFILTSKKMSNFFLLKNLSLLIFSFLVFLSFSKIAIFTFIFLNLIYFLLKTKKCSLCFFAKLIIFFTLSLIFFFVKTDPLTLEKRFTLIENSFKILIKKPFGVGLGNYLIFQNQIPSKIYLFFNQPVHNVFLLSLNELGIFLWGFLIYLLIKKTQNLKINFYLLITIILTGLFDHYWLTLPQNFFLIAVILALF